MFKYAITTIIERLFAKDKFLISDKGLSTKLILQAQELQIKASYGFISFYPYSSSVKSIWTLMAVRLPSAAANTTWEGPMYEASPAA